MLYVDATLKKKIYYLIFVNYRDVVKHKLVSKPNEKPKYEAITTTVKRFIKFPSLETVAQFDYKQSSFVKKLQRTGPSYPLLKVLQQFRDKYERDPNPKQREDDLNRLFEIRNEIAENLVPDTAFTHVFAQISPAAAIVGGALAQEIIKTVSQKEAPHHNVFLFDPETCCGFVERIVAQ